MTGAMAIWAAGGAMSWSLAEYLIHRFVGHEGKGRNEFSREHLAHHADGNYFAANAKKARAAGVVLGALAVLLAPLLGIAAAVAYVGGFGVAYAAYEVLHRRLHTHPPRGPYGRWARRHHFYHHFQSPRKNHGVSSPLWDHVFRTYEEPGVVRVPRRHAMVWLADAERAAVLPAYAQDYVLAGRVVRRTEAEQQRDLEAAYAGVAPEAAL